MSDPRPPSDIEALLPFYANGWLSPADRARVESALDGSPRLSAELAAVRDLAAAVRADGETMAPTPPASAERLARLLARIDEENPGDPDAQKKLG